MEKELFVRAEEVARELGISKPYAYKLVREMNEELKKGRPCWGRQPQLPGAKPPHHPVGRKCAFDGRQAVKSAIALLSQKVTKARRLRGGKGRRD